MKNRRKAVQPFEIKKRKIDIFRNYEAYGFEKNQRKFENFSTLISKKSNEAFDPEEAHRLRDKLELHYTPKHGSWLNVAEIGFSILKRQCIPFRVADINVLRNTVNSFIAQRNAEKRVVNWQFTTGDARIKLRHLYPDL